MTIKELIKTLSKHPNQDADVKIIANISLGGEDDEMDVYLEKVEVWGEDDFNNEYAELFCYNPNKED
jgi:hypothetical protein